MPKPSATDAQIELLLLSLTAVVEDMIVAKCGALNGRDRATLKRRMVKALKLFVQGAQPVKSRGK